MAGTAATMASYWPPPQPQISLVWGSEGALHTAPKTLSQVISPLSAMVPYCAQRTGERTLQVIKPTGLAHCARLGQGSPPRLWAGLSTQAGAGEGQLDPAQEFGRRVGICFTPGTGVKALLKINTFHARMAHPHAPHKQGGSLPAPINKHPGNHYRAGGV